MFLKNTCTLLLKTAMFLKKITREAEADKSFDKKGYTNTVFEKWKKNILVNTPDYGGSIRLQHYSHVLYFQAAVSFHLLILYYKRQLINAYPDDNKYCYCAIAGKASFLVTEDKHFSILKKISLNQIVFFYNVRQMYFRN